VDLIGVMQFRSLQFSEVSPRLWDLSFLAGHGSGRATRKAMVLIIRLAGQSPKAMIIGKVNSLTAIGAVVMRVPTVTDLGTLLR